MRRLSSVIIVSACVLVSCMGVQRVEPTIGPVDDQAVSAGMKGEWPSLYAVLSSNTNCADVGEVVTLNLYIANEKDYAMTLTDEPFLDMVITAPDAKTTERWSQTSQYPSVITPTLSPGERRSYRWQWTVTDLYYLEPMPERAIRNGLHPWGNAEIHVYTSVSTQTNPTRYLFTGCSPYCNRC